MSEITIDFSFRFEEDADAQLLHSVLSLIHQGHYAEAKKHLATSKIDLQLEDQSDMWWLERYHRDGRYLFGYLVGGTSSFDEGRFLNAVSKSGATHILANVENTQVGAGYAYALRNGKESKSATVLKDFAKENPSIALGVAIDKGKKKDALSILATGVNPNSTFNGSSLLPLSIEQGQFAVAEALLAAGADPNATMAHKARPNQPGEETALHLAVIRGKKKLVKILLDAGADPNKLDGLGRSALHEAVSSDSMYPLAMMLIEYGAFLNSPRDKDGVSPFIEFLSHASDYIYAGSDEVKKGKAALKLFDLMQKHGLSIDDHCAGGGNSYWYAWDHQALRNQLASMGCDTLVAPAHAYPQGETYKNIKESIYRQDKERFTAEMADFYTLSQKEKDDLLATAIFYNRRDNIKVLVESGANPNSIAYGEAPLYLFFAESYPDDDALINFLREHATSDISNQDERQRRAFEDYLSYEKWYATLADFREEYEDGKSYYSDALYGYAVKNRAVDYFNILKRVVSDTAHQPKVERTRNEKRFRIIRPYTGLSGREDEAIFEMIESEERYVVDNIELF